MTPEEKSKYYLSIFNGDVFASIRVCDRMIISCEFNQSYYEQVKEILINKLKQLCQ